MTRTRRQSLLQQVPAEQHQNRGHKKHVAFAVEPAFKASDLANLKPVSKRRSRIAAVPDQLGQSSHPKSIPTPASLARGNGSNIPEYTITRPLPPHLFSCGHDPNTIPYLVHLTYLTSASQDSALARISGFSESRDHVGQYLSLQQITKEGLRVCRGFLGHNVAVRTIADWLNKVWEVEIQGTCNLKNQTERWWVEFCTPHEVQLIKVLEEVGVLKVGLCDGKNWASEEEGSELLSITARPDVTLKTRTSTPTSSTLWRQPVISVSSPKVHFANQDVPRTKNHSNNHGPKSSDSPSSPSAYIISQLRSNKLSSSNQTTAHELAHFAYHASEQYRSLVESLYNRMSSVTRMYIETLLVEGVGYAASVCVDEWQAYLVAEGVGWLLPEKSGASSIAVGLATNKKSRSASGQMAKVREDLIAAEKVLRAEWARGRPN